MRMRIAKPWYVCVLFACAFLTVSGCDAQNQYVTNAGHSDEASSSGMVLPEHGRAENGQITVAAYNLKNYLTMDRWIDGKRVEGKPKPEEEIRILVRIITDIRPDILLVSEIGQESDFLDLQQRLAEAGIEYSDSEFLEAADDTRRLGLLSRFPISERNSLGKLGYNLNGGREYIQRGILDATVDVTDDYKLRVLGVHLKSKRPVPQGEALIRRNEAHLLRKHIDAILEENPEVNLLVGGDLNDTKNEPPVQEIIGSRSSDQYMADIWLEDPLGDRWTHYWSSADLYSRIDYILVSRGLFPEIDKKDSYVYRSLDVLEASDHRPVVVIIDPQEQ